MSLAAAGDFSEQLEDFWQQIQDFFNQLPTMVFFSFVTAVVALYTAYSQVEYYLQAAWDWLLDVLGLAPRPWARASGMLPGCWIRVPWPVRCRTWAGWTRLRRA